MLAQVILVVRAPFESQGAIGAQEGTESSVDTLMDLSKDRHGEISLSFGYILFALIKSMFIKMTWFDI